MNTFAQLPVGAAFRFFDRRCGYNLRRYVKTGPLRYEGEDGAVYDMAQSWADHAQVFTTN